MAALGGGSFVAVLQFWYPQCDQLFPFTLSSRKAYQKNCTNYNHANKSYLRALGLETMSKAYEVLTIPIN
ncbi:MAG: hypothetical protein AWT59_1324 [Candidatus Gallionella acididurans]|uniref:Uncharacterized protein n=1 Tax=Candidatus Gallionella acididurans TaxID=1796491 RepID=A0A139BV15_9PROT|nr:MAG: hypothetical protein AWT59_1324 [Candidatus Gallionella acididurans]